LIATKSPGGDGRGSSPTPAGDSLEERVQRDRAQQRLRHSRRARLRLDSRRRAVATLWGELTTIGYESGDALHAAHGAGFESIGELVVWINEPSTSA
jgi:hypothetical protein